MPISSHLVYGSFLAPREELSSLNKGLQNCKYLLSGLLREKFNKPCPRVIESSVSVGSWFIVSRD